MQFKLAIKTSLYTSAILLLLVGIGGAGNAKVFACGYYGGGCGYSGYGDLGYGGCGGYCAGQQDASYDHDNGLSYNPIGQCLPCHSDDYWSSFHQGYDRQWNTYQSQDTNQGSSINIYGNNNYVSTNQYSNQQQNPLQQLAHMACGVINCGGLGPQPAPYQQSGYDP